MAERGGAGRKAAGVKGTGKSKAAAKPTRSEAQRRRKAAERKAERERAEQMDLARQGLSKAAKTIETAESYLAIFEDWLAGMEYGALARKHELSVSRCEQIVHELRGQRLHALRLGDPMLGLRVAQDLILRWTSSISAYAELARSTSQDAVKLGALRRRDEALEAFANLMQELGYLPKHLGTLRIQEDFIALIEALLDKMDELGLDLAVQRALVEAVEMRVAPRGDRLVLDPGGVVDAEVVDGQAAA